MTAPVAPGDVLLAKYRVERILGQGGMGVVVAARHIELGELFAIKFLLPHAIQHPQAVERFVREARASARLKGEHVAKVHDVGRLPDGLPYMVLEYLSGKDLKDTLGERGPLPVAEAVAYVLQACEAIAEAHGLGIVHRDLKPANLFLTRRPNGTPCVKVLDFGISRQVEPAGAEQHGLTTTGMLLGSPYYMSPEQMLRTKEADARSDIWSVGCVLYELLTGRVPFHAEALTELVGKVLQEEPRPPSAYRGDIPPAVEAAVMRCLVKSKEQRFQSIQEFAEALQASLRPAPQPGPIPPARAVMPSQPEHVVPVPLASPSAVPAISSAAPIATTAPGWGTTSPDAGRASPPKRRAPLLAGVAVGIGALLGGAWLMLRPAPQPSTEAADAAIAAARSASAPEVPSAAPLPMPSAQPTAAEPAAEPPPAPAPPASAPPSSTPPASAPPSSTPPASAPPASAPTPKVSALHKRTPAATTTSAPAPPSPVAAPAAAPAAEPTAATKKRGSMY